MRCFQLPLLALMAAFLISGCGKVQQAKQAAETKAETRFSDMASSDAGEKAAAPAEGVATLPSSSPAPEATDGYTRDFAKAEPPRSDKPADLLIPAKAKPAAEKHREPKRQQVQPQIQAGTLTAGSLNDQQNLDDYREYLSQAQQSAAGRNLPPFTLGERVMIEVRDAQGNGVADAQITIREIGQNAAANKGVLLDTYTRADGKTFFASGWDAPTAGNEKSFELTIHPQGKKAITRQVSVSQSPWVVDLPDATRQLPQKLDLAFLVDTTQSMADELNYLKVELDNIAARVHRMFPDVEQRYALIVYRDEGDEYVVRNAIDFTASLPDFRARLAEQSARGGGDLPEAMHLALENANKLSWRKKNTARVLFLVADASPHPPHYQRAMNAVEELRRKGVAVYPLAGSGPMQECEFLMRAMAFLTRGQYLFLTDHSGVGNPHAKPHAPKYEVEPLNQLMIRMIASELSGKPVLAQEILATEESNGSELDPLPEQQNQSSTEEAGHGSPFVSHAEPAHFATNGHPSQPMFWESTTFRFLAAFAIIGGILLLDQRLRG